MLDIIDHGWLPTVSHIFLIWYILQLSNVPRIEPRLQAMVFRKKFEEELKELTPDIANVMAACEEVRESEKFAKTLEVRN